MTENAYQWGIRHRSCEPAVDRAFYTLTVQQRDAAYQGMKDRDAEIERLQALVRQKDTEVQSARFLADQKLALRREVEEALGVEPGAAGDEQFARGMARLRAVLATMDRLRTVADEAFGPFEVLPIDELLSQVEKGIFAQRRTAERLRRAYGDAIRIARRNQQALEKAEEALTRNDAGLSALRQHNEQLREDYRVESLAAHDAQVQRDALLAQRARVVAVLDRCEAEDVKAGGPAGEQQLGRWQLLDEIRAALAVDAR